MNNLTAYTIINKDNGSQPRRSVRGEEPEAAHGAAAPASGARAA